MHVRYTWLAMCRVPTAANPRFRTRYDGAVEWRTPPSTLRPRPTPMCPLQGRQQSQPSTLFVPCQHPIVQKTPGSARSGISEELNQVGQCSKPNAEHPPDHLSLYIPIVQARQFLPHLLLRNGSGKLLAFASKLDALRWTHRSEERGHSPVHNFNRLDSTHPIHACSIQPGRPLTPPSRSWPGSAACRHRARAAPRRDTP